MSNTTPGPWTYDGNKIAGYYIGGADGTEVCEFNAKAHNPADAVLIAAAPDMLAALYAILFQVTQGKVLERDACIEQARAAYIKATSQN